MRRQSKARVVLLFAIMKITIAAALCALTIPGIFLAARVFSAAPPPARPPSPSPQSTSDPFRVKIETIAAMYPGIVKSQHLPCSWAQSMCALPPIHGHPTHDASLASTGQHAGKLYQLWASSSAREGKLAGVGQIVVKEAWHTEKAPSGTPDLPKGTRGVLGTWSHDGSFGCRSTPWVQKGEDWYKAGQRAGLFVMAKLDPKTEGTDAGWIYGTVTADGAVTTAGKVQECVSCHESAPHDRLFTSLDEIRNPIR